MIELIIFVAGIYCGHVISPWIDGKVADFKAKFNQPDPNGPDYEGD
jgi:hypothetical protein